MNRLDHQYQMMLWSLLQSKTEKSDRTGTGTLSKFGMQIRHNMKDGFPLLTTKKMAFKTMVTELLWFLRGDTNIKFLVENGCHIWDGDAYKNYVKHQDTEDVGTMDWFIDKIKTNDEFAQVWGDLGPIYGAQWRKWPSSDLAGGTIDQIGHLIHQLKNNPDSRRLMVSAWNVDDLEYMVLPPCHYGFQVYTRELTLDERIDYFNSTKTPLSRSMDYHHAHMDSLRIPKRAISLMWNQRSVDTFLGLPFNIASYGLLLEIIAKEVNMIPDELIGNLGDTHLYLNHVEQAKEQIDRKSFELPTLKIQSGVKREERDCLPAYSVSDFILENYQSHPSIKAPLSN